MARAPSDIAFLYGDCSRISIALASAVASSLTLLWNRSFAYSSPSVVLRTSANTSSMSSLWQDIVCELMC
jgi:hypothetical protein